MENQTQKSNTGFSGEGQGEDEPCFASIGLKHAMIE